MRDRRDDTTHRRVLEAKLGRKLLQNELPHHLDEDKTNNTPSNLVAKDRSEHSRDHGKEQHGLRKLRKALRMVKEGRKAY